MEETVWRLTKGNRELEIYKVDVARRLTLLLSLRLSKPMTQEEALKYVNDNYPSGSNAVRLAAETLGQRRG